MQITSVSSVWSRSSFCLNLPVQGLGCSFCDWIIPIPPHTRNISCNKKMEEMMKTSMIVLFMFCVLHLFATIINIPADFPTIQEGIIASVDLDTVLVQTGIYYENINFIGRNIILTSNFITTQDTFYIEETIINGSFFKYFLSMIWILIPSSNISV